MQQTRLKYYHLRRMDEALKNDKNPRGIMSRGGVTVAIVDDNDKKTVAIALCSDKDNYSKKIGRKITLGRIYSRVHENKIPKWTKFYGEDITIEDILYEIKLRYLKGKHEKK